MVDEKFSILNFSNLLFERETNACESSSSFSADSMVTVTHDSAYLKIGLLWILKLIKKKIFVLFNANSVAAGS